VDHVDIDAKRYELEMLRTQVRELENELQAAEAERRYVPPLYYGSYYATTGFLLGIFGAAASLLVNIIGAPIVGKSPLELIRVYLTFPLGEKALQLSDPAHHVFAISDGTILAIGCCLYLATGMVLGVPFYVALTWWAGRASFVERFITATVLSLALWAISFYGILSWLQPMLFGGNWIVSGQYLPWWVAAGTHLVFGWTLMALYPLGQYTPYSSPVQK
jgi:hypothetical protein